MKLIARSMKLITRSKERERRVWDVGKNINREKTQILKVLIDFFVLVDNKTYIEFGKVRYRNYLVSLDDIWLSFASSNII